MSGLVPPAGLIRVAHVCESLEVGGLEKLLVEFARHADRGWFDLRFVTLAGRGSLAGEVEALGWPVRALELGDGLRERARALGRLARLFARERVGVVHTHSEGPLLYGAPAARLARVRRVIHTRHHGPDLGRSRRALRAMALASRCVDLVACVAEDGARHAVAEGVPASRVVTVWNGIDLKRFACAGPRPGGPAVAVARLTPEKDLATLLCASAEALTREPDFRLEIAGDGPLRGELEELAGSLGLGERVRFLGQVDDVAGLLGRAGLLVLSSVKEGVPLTLLEAMARGLPVVATRVGGCPEVVEDGRTGLLVPPGEPGALAAAVLALWRDHGRAAGMGRAGRERAESHFDVRRTVARYESMYLDRSTETATARAVAGFVSSG
jgi:glycosyltransferase involved in cell wall biosynthesis